MNKADSGSISSTRRIYIFPFYSLHSYKPKFSSLRWAEGRTPNINNMPFVPYIALNLQTDFIIEKTMNFWVFNTGYDAYKQHMTIFDFHIINGKIL